MNNTNTGSNGKYGIAELIGNKSEKAWPSAEVRLLFLHEYTEELIEML